MNEFDLIRRYFHLPSQHSVALGIGDDAAVVRLAPGEQLVVTVDTLVEDVHFPKNSPAHLVAARCLRTNLSDLAAMGAEPRWFTLALTLPNTDANWLEGFSRGLAQESALWKIDLIGGDTTKGPLTISVQMMGVSTGKWLARSGAKAGDAVLVTGNLGDAAGYLAKTENLPELQDSYLHRRFWLPDPRLGFALQGVELIRAACDISDGLLADLEHICRASGLGADIQIDALPLSDALRENFASTAKDLALSGGDDYELCLAVTPGDLPKLQDIARDLGVPLTQIGQFREGSGVNCFDGQAQVQPKQSGYLHFDER